MAPALPGHFYLEQTGELARADTENKNERRNSAGHSPDKLLGKA